MSITDKAKERAKKNPNLLFGFLIICHLILISFNRSSDRPDLRIIQRVVFIPVTLLGSGVSGGRSLVAGLWQRYIDLRGVSEENRQLKTDLVRIDSEMVRLREKLAEYRNLQNLLETTNYDGYQRITARVVSRDVNHLFGTVIIDKGSFHGIQKDQPVVDATGLVGRVILVTTLSSRVLLITDERHGSGALITKVPGVDHYGVIRGIRDNFYCEMDFLTTPVLLENGQTVVTSGQDGIYPRGLLVGRVANPADKSASTQQRNVIAPAAALDRLDLVSVLQVTGDQIRAAAKSVEAEEKRQEAVAASKK